MSAANEDSLTVVSRQKAIVNVLLVYLLLFVSGSWRYNLSSDRYLIVGFLISFLAWYQYSDRKISDKFILYTVVFAAFLFTQSVYTAGSLSISSVIASTIKIVLPYFIIKTVGERFVDAYIKVVVFLAAISLFGYLSDVFNLLDGIVRKLPNVQDVGYEGILYLYRFSWHIERNNSIFFEPGAYQVFLNAALFFLFFMRTDFSIKRKWIYITILTITLITTFSTAGYLIFAVLLLVFFIKSPLLTFRKKIMMAGLGIIAVGVFSNQFYSTVTVKVNDYLTAHEYDFGASAQNRSSDAKTDLKVFRKHIFGAGYDEYYKEFSIAGRVDPERGYSSNGVTKMLAVYGLPFSLFVFGSYYWALKRMLNEFLLTAASFVMLMMFLAAESWYMMSPTCLAIVASAFITGQMPVRGKKGNN